jgi:hypothetical protein
MAGPGTYTAYQQVRPIQNDLSDEVRAGEDRFFRNKQAQAQEDRYQQQRQDALNKQMSEDMSALDPVITGIQSVDEINYGATSAAMSRIGDIYRMFRSNPQMQNDPTLRMELANLKNFPKILEANQKRLVEYTTNLSEGFAEGTYSEWDKDLLDETEAFFGVKQEDGSISPNYVIQFDKKGSPYFVGKTKEGRMFKRSLSGIINGYEYADATKAFSAEEYAETMSKALGKREEVSIGGKFITNSQTFAAHEDRVRNDIRTALGTAEDPSDLAKSIWVDQVNMGRNKEDFNESSLKEIEEYLVDKVRMRYDETKSVSERRKDTTSTDAKATPGQGIQLMTDTEGGALNPFPTTGDSKGFAFSLPKAVGFGVGEKERKINALYLRPDGSIVAKGQEPVPDGDGGFSFNFGDPKSEYQETFATNSEEINTIARQLGFNNAAELKTYLKDLGKQGTTSSGSSGSVSVNGRNYQ